MKLGSLKGGRDGRLVVVSDDLAWCADATHIAPTLQAALDDWAEVAPQLELLSTDLAHEAIPMMRFHERQADAPLPRAYQWADGSAYVNHVELVRKARGAEMPESFWTDPLMYQGASDEMLGPRDPIPLGDEGWGCDLEAEIVVVTDDVPRGISREAALDHVKLIGLVNDVSLRNLIPAELAKGFGFLQSKPASALSPVLVTPDELGERWKDGKLHGPLKVDLNGEPFGRADAGEDMTFETRGPLRSEPPLRDPGTHHGLDHGKGERGRLGGEDRGRRRSSDQPRDRLGPVDEDDGLQDRGAVGAADLLRNIQIEPGFRGDLEVVTIHPGAV